MIQKIYRFRRPRPFPQSLTPKDGSELQLTIQNGRSQQKKNGVVVERIQGTDNCLYFNLLFDLVGRRSGSQVWQH